MAFTLELGCQKTTPKANLPVIYSDARDAMIDFMLWLKILLKNKIQTLKFNLSKVAWVHGYPRKNTRRAWTRDSKCRNLHRRSKTVSKISKLISDILERYNRAESVECSF